MAGFQGSFSSTNWQELPPFAPRFGTGMELLFSQTLHGVWKGGGRTKTSPRTDPHPSPRHSHPRGMILHGAWCGKHLETQRLRRAQQLNRWLILFWFLFFFLSGSVALLLWIEFCHRLYRSQMTRVFWNTVPNIFIPPSTRILSRKSRGEVVSV